MAQSQPANSKDVCRAKRDLWDTEHINLTNGPMDDKLSASQLSSRMGEMAHCASDVDFENLHSYTRVSENYSGTLSLRYLSFLKRHDLMKQFLAEDAAGQR